MERKLDRMSLRSSGPRRSESVESYLRQTRAGAALALLALAAAVASEEFAEHLWVHHPLLAGLASSAIVVMLSVAVLNEALEIRRRRRWRVLAQYVMLELVRDARMVWTAVVGLAGLMPTDENPSATIDAAALVVRDTPRLTKAVQSLHRRCRSAPSPARPRCATGGSQRRGAGTMGRKHVSAQPPM